MIGNVRRINTDASIYISLILTFHTGIRQTHISRGGIGPDAAGRTQTRREEIIQILIIRIHRERQDYSGLVNANLVIIGSRTAVCHKGVLYGSDTQIPELTGTDYGFNSAATLNINLITGFSAQMPALVSAKINGILWESSVRVFSNQRVELSEFQSPIIKEECGIDRTGLFIEDGIDAQFTEIALQIVRVAVIIHLHVE